MREGETVKKLLFIVLTLFCFSFTPDGAVKEFARGQYKDKKNKTWAHTIIYEIKGGRSEVDNFIIGKKIIEIKKIKSNYWIIVIAR